MNNGMQLLLCACEHAYGQSDALTRAPSRLNTGKLARMFFIHYIILTARDPGDALRQESMS